MKCKQSSNKVAGYIRVSSGRQAETGYSLEAQKKAIQRYCELKGWHLTKYYEDAGISGKSTRRPNFQKMMEDASKGLFDKVVTFKLDRISRNVKDLLNLTEDLEKLGIDFVTIEENIDTSTAIGKMLRTILAAVAQFESDVAKERTYDAKAELASQGKYAGGNIPYGYSYDRNTRGFAIVDEEAMVVEEIFQSYRSGKTAYAIAKYLNEHNVPTKRGGNKWQANMVDIILSNRFYTGRYEWEGIVTWGEHEAIISDRLFEKVQEIMAQRKRVRVYEETDKNTTRGDGGAESPAVKEVPLLR